MTLNPSYALIFKPPPCFKHFLGETLLMMRVVRGMELGTFCQENGAGDVILGTLSRLGLSTMSWGLVDDLYI